MEIGISGKILTHKNTKVYMGQQYPYPIIWEKNIVAIIHIYGDIAIVILFYENQDTASE